MVCPVKEHALAFLLLGSFPPGPRCLSCELANLQGFTDTKNTPSAMHYLTLNGCQAPSLSTNLSIEIIHSLPSMSADLLGDPKSAEHIFPSLEISSHQSNISQSTFKKPTYYYPNLNYNPATATQRHPYVSHEIRATSVCHVPIAAQTSQPFPS